MQRKNFFHIILIAISFICYSNGFSTHLVGGFISYQYISSSGSGHRYLITITSYRDCKPNSIQFANDIDVCVYNRNDLKLFNTYNFKRNSVEKVNPVGRTDCPEATQVCLEKAIFSGFIDLPTSAFGYFVKWEICCRNTQVNLRDDANTGKPFIGQTYQTIIPPTAVKNSSPFFTDVPVPFICINDTTQLNNYAIDPDGDSLVYKLATPWYGASFSNNYPGCTPYYDPPVSISPGDYNPGYNGNIPFGSNGVSLINSANGVATFMAKKIGNYAVALDLFEYRNGVFLSSTRLDLQILVINCTPNNKPTISSSTAAYTIMAGDKLCFNVTSKDKDNDNIDLSGQGDLLTGANGFTGNRATFNNAYGKGTVSSQFCWQTSCSQGRNTPYIFTAKAVDDGCPSKFTFVNVNITVLPFTGKVTLSGPLNICEGTKNVPYNMNVTTNTPEELIGLTYNITVNGGTLVSQSANQLIISWNKGITNASISIRAVSRFGCQGEPTLLNVSLIPSPPKPILIPVDTVCENSVRTYSVQNIAGYIYKWIVTNGNVLGASNQNSVNIVWGSAGKAFAQVVQYNSNGCPSDTGTIAVWISKPQTPAITGKQSICPNANGLTYFVSQTSPGSKFKWFVNGGMIADSSKGNSILVNWGNPGLGFVKVIEINKFSCPGDTVRLPVLKTYALSGEIIAGDTDLCEFTLNESYSVLATPATNYTWSVSGGIIVSGQGSNSIRVNWGSAGNGQISVFETSYDSVNNKQCISNLITRQVHIRPYPNANTISGTFEVCQSSGKGIFKLNGMAGSTYQWTINGDSSGIIGQNTNTVQIPFDKDGSFAIRVIETSLYSCLGNPVDTVLIVHPKPRTGPIQGNSIICFPNLNNYKYSVNGFATSTFTWIVQGGSFVLGSNASEIFVNWSGQQNNKVQVIETSDFSCPGDTISLDVFYDNPYVYLNYITVTPPPLSDDGMNAFWSLRNAPKYNNQIFIEKRKAGSGSAFSLAGTVNGSQVLFNDYKTMNDSNAWEYRIKAFDLCGQEFYSSIHTNILLQGIKTGGYSVSMNFTPYLGWGSTGIRYDLYRLLKNSGDYELYDANITSFQAAFANGLEYYTQCYRVKGTKIGTDTITWSNDICFNFDPVIFIPDAFSPNNDDNNDVFRIRGGALKTVNYLIFNRWGEKIFEGNSLADTWDGTYKSREQPQDVYMYYCYYSGFDSRKYSTKGTITLLR